MIDKKALHNNLIVIISSMLYQAEKDIPRDGLYIKTSEIPELARMEYSNDRIFNNKVEFNTCVIMQLIDKFNPPPDPISTEADAARYRHLRESWARCEGSKLVWHIPHAYCSGTPIAERLDASIDSEISYKERQK